MANYNPNKHGVPDKRNAQQYKDFIRQKYVDKKFEKRQEKVYDSDSSEDEAERRARKEKKKARKAAKRQLSSDSDEPAPMQKEEKKVGTRFAAPPSSKRTQP